MNGFEHRQRVFAAAHALFEEVHFKRYPTCVEVRTRAQTDMNTTVKYLREWRAEAEGKAH